MKNIPDKKTGIVEPNTLKIVLLSLNSNFLVQSRYFFFTKCHFLPTIGFHSDYLAPIDRALKILDD